jgi:DNA-binding MarR family transcriptional regulator
MPALSAAHHQAWYLFLTAHAKLVDRVNRHLAAAGVLSLEWYDVLLALSQAPKHRLRMSELAEKVTLSRSGLTRLVDRLEATDLLRRENCAEDRRGAFAVLSPAGLRALKKTWPNYEKEIQRSFARQIDAEEAKVIAAALTRVVRAMEDVANQSGSGNRGHGVGVGGPPADSDG